MTALPDAPIRISGLELATGSHDSDDGELCLLEAASVLVGEPFGDHPRCVSPVLAGFGINLNDQWKGGYVEQRQKLRMFLPPVDDQDRALVRALRVDAGLDPDVVRSITGTAGDGQDEARGYLALDWLIRTYTPAWLDLAGLTVEAAELRELRRIVDLAAAQSARPVVRNAQTKAAAAWAAAWVAARDAAGAAAGAAAWAAAWAAAGAAARVAARDAAGAAAWDAAGAAARVAARVAAWDAAGDALTPTVKILQASALHLFDAMIDPSAVTA